MKPIVSTAWLSKNLNDPALVILDASLESNVANLKVEYPDIQIKGTRFFDFKNVFVDKNSHLPNMLPTATVFEKECRKLGINTDSKIIVYDNVGVYASPRVWWMFKAMGHDSIAVLDGGLTKWKDNNLDCEPKKQTKVSPGDFKANYQPELVRNSLQILENITRKNEVVIDSRSTKRFEGTIPETREHLKSGHIPNSLNLPFLEVLNDGKFLTKEKLTLVFNNFNIKDKDLIFTCGSGITACILQLASEIIGCTNTSIYDGSWTDWGQIEGYPIEK
jgi:thiosulfate/3-mercaptopyruvate sulfurtransferase